MTFLNEVFEGFFITILVTIFVTEILLRKRAPDGISSHLGAKLRDWAVRQAGAGCYSLAALSSNDSKTRYLQISSQPCYGIGF